MDARPTSEQRAVIVAAVEEHTAAVLALAQRICVIPAPSFSEEQRAAFVKAEFDAQGLSSWIDEVGNVCARRPGTGQGLLL